jgi:hypothetical protein
MLLSGTYVLPAARGIDSAKLRGISPGAGFDHLFSSNDPRALPGVHCPQWEGKPEPHQRRQSIVIVCKFGRAMGIETTT